MGALEEPQDVLDLGSVLYRSTLDYTDEHDSKRVHEYMPLTSLNLLSCIMAENPCLCEQSERFASR